VLEVEAVSMSSSSRRASRERALAYERWYKTLGEAEREAEDQRVLKLNAEHERAMTTLILSISLVGLLLMIYLSVIR
jgi:hypothetical protein